MKPSSKQPSFWESVTKKSTELGETLSNSASQLSKVASETVAGFGESVNNAVSQATTAINTEKQSGNTMTQTLELAKIHESDRLAFYGALFAIATADGSFDKDEINFIFGVMDLEGMSESAKRQVQSYIIEPPALASCLRALSIADETLRFGLMLNLIDTAWANDELDPDEEQAIKLAQQELRITDAQVKAMQEFVQKMREIRERGLDDNQAADAVKTAASGLGAVGIPIAAVYFSGSVIGLSAAGITSGLAALGGLVGLGGMVPGIGVAVLLGAGIFMGLNSFLDTGDHHKKAELQAERERKAQLVIQNLQNSLNSVIERIDALQKAAADTEGNREAIRILTQKMKTLQQLINKRKQARSEA